MTIDFITQEKDYWVASNAINITLNALSNPNRIQCSVSSGAVVRCFYEHIDEADSLGYTVAHDYHQWPISSSPTYFNSDTEKYVYIAIPRSAAVGVQAIVVFPSDKLDIYGRKAVKSTDPETGEETIVYEQIGSTDYFYVWLQATISAPLLIDGVLQRIWTTQIATGKLDTPQGDAERETDSEWYLWSAIGGFVTFLREIRMSVDSWFANIRLGKDKRELTGVATADTPDEFVDSETLVVTPSYLSNKFLRKDMDDSTPYSLGVGEDLTVGGDVDVTGQERVDVVQSHNYSGSGLADTGFLITNDNGSGDSLGVFDYLTVRKKMIINSLEIKETHFSAGDVAHTLASAEIARTDYFYVDEEGNRELLGYSTILVPWSLRGGLLALAKGNLKGIFGHYKKVRLTLTQSQLERCNRIRCYFLAKDGDREVENWFRANDLVRCQTWNVLKTKRETFIPNLEEHDGNVYWWRKVHDVSWNTGVTRYVAKDAQGQPTDQITTDGKQAYVNEGGVKRLYDNGIYHTKGTEGYDDHQPVTIDGNTYHWFDVDYNYFSDESVAAAGSDIPAAGDKVIQFGNTTDPDRMNIFMIEVNGAGNPDAPDWKMYRGVYTFNLTNCWWGGESCRKTKWSVATGIEAYAPQFNWITEYGIARQVFVRDEVYWNKIPFERDDDWSKAVSSYPDYSDDIVDANGRFVSRADGSPKNYVRKCRYYEQVSHNGSAWLCSVAESFYWRSADGRKIPAKTDGAEYVRNYTYDEPSAESNNWTEQVEKGDPGAFKSTVFCRSNSTPAAPSNDKKDGCNTFDNPVPPAVSGQPTWTDGIPDGTAILWASTAWFYSDGTHQNWTTPRQQTDTETLDIEFSPNSNQPSAPYNIPVENRGNGTRYGTYGTNSRANGSGQQADWYDPALDGNNDYVSWDNMKWRAERKISNGEYIGQWTISRIKGENSVRIDLDNENDSMLYTSGGKLVSGNVLSTARLFDGATDVSTSADWKMTAVGCTMSSGDSRNIVVTGMTAATGYVNVQAVYTDKNGTVYTKTTRLTLKKLVDVDKYDLDITPNSIAYNATKDQPATSTLTIKVWKMTVDGNRVLSNPPSGYGVYVNNSKQTASSDGTYSYTTDNSAISSVQVKIAKDADLDAILDSETIPVNKAEDGAPGTSPYFADIDNEMDSVACDKNGKTLTAYDTTIGVSLWHGSHPLDITTLTTDSIQGFTITPNKSARTIRIQVAKDTSIAEVNKIGITIAGNGSGNLPLHFVLNGVRQGENGEPAVLYSLVPSVSSVVKKKDGTYSVDNVSCTRQKNVGGTITNNTTDGAITYKLDGGTEKAYTNNTDIAVTSFTKSIQFIFKVDGKVVDIETIPMVADGVDGVTPTVAIVDGYWVINGQSTGVKAEGTDGTGVEIKGTVASPSKMTIRDGKGYAIPMNSDGSDAPEVEVKHGDCYICNSDRHLYMFTNTPEVAWNDLGEFQGKPGADGKNSYMHIAYAKKNPLNVTTATVDTIGFTVNSDGSQYEWMGFCTDDKKSDPGRNWGSLSPSQKVAAVNAYKWNYMKGKDGSGYEYIYLLTKEGFKPTIDESSGQGSQSDDEFYPSVGNYQDGKIYDNSRYWNDDPPADISETWPVLWWASRKKSNGVWQAFGSVDLHNRYAKDGTSPYFADIDNEMDSVACDKNGKTLTAYDTTIGVSLWHGSHPLDITTLTTDSIQGFTITPDKTARTIRIQVAQGTSIAEVNKIGITIAGSGSGNLPLHFVLNGVRQGENGEPAVLYSLVPSVSSVVKKKDGTYSVDNVSCTRQKNVGGTITNNTTDGAITYKLDGGTEKTYTNNTDIAVTSFTKSIQFIFKVDGKVVDIETIPMVADGVDGVTPTVEIVDGYWVINGQSTGVKAEGTDGTGVEIKGTVASPSKMTIRDDKGYATPMNSDGSDAPEVEVKHGDCYICNSDRHLYMFTSTPAVAWNDLGEFQGKPGKNSYMHIAYAKKNPLNVTTSTVDTIGFTVNSDGSQYEWMGFCADDKGDDPGKYWDTLTPEQKVAAVNAYKWNYMKGKDGSGVEYIYLLTKEGFKPTIDETGGQGTQSADEFLPKVGNYEAGKIYGDSQYWKDDPPADVSETWPVIWWAERKYQNGAWGTFGTVTLHNRYAKDGSSPWIADLDNEMDSIACDNDGKPIVQQAVSTNVSLFYGSQKKAFITSVNGGDTGITISFSNKTAATAKDSDTVTITFATNAVISGKKEFEITLTAKDDASIQRVLTLTVNGLKGGATYNLVPSDSFVLLNKANQYVPSVLTCTYNKFDVAKGQFVTPAGGTVKYIKDGETAENAYKQLVPGTDFTNNVTFLLYVGTTLVDRETIHIVKDGTDGLSAQSYIETQEAWSNQETTASADTMPSDCQEGDWKDSTPANTNSRTYLWRRSRKMTLKTDKSGYDAGQWSYTRLSGTNGTSIKTQGTVANTSKLLDRQVIPLVNGSDGQRTDVQDGWAYISEADRHLYQWSDELRSKSSTWVDWRSGWLDLGEFKGESGKTYYTHIAWAKGIILKKDGDGRAVTTDRTAGQRTMPNAVYPMTAEELELFDFSIAPQEDLTWMGTLVDEDTTDAADYKYYTWKYVQGSAGKNAVRIDLDNQADLVSVDADGKVRFARTVVVRARIFDGAAMVTDDSKVSHSMTKASMKIGSREPSSIVKSNGVVTVQWDFSKGDSVTDQPKTFTLNYGSQGYSEEFTLGTTKSDVIYQLLPSPSEVSFSKGSDGKTLTPSQINLYGGYVKENGGAPVTVQQPNGSQMDSSNYLYYRIKGANGIWGAWTAYPASPNNFLQVTSSTTNTDIEFCISTAPDAGSVSDSNIVDRENVPIVKDGINGDKGENSIRLALDNEHEDFLYNASGALVSPAGGATSQARLYDGALPISANSVTWAVDFSKSSGVPTAGQNAPTCVNGLLTVPHVTGASAKVAVKATYDSKDYFAEFTANKTEGDKYDIVVKPNAIPYNSSEAFTEKTINLSVKGIDAQGHNIDSISIDTSATPSAGKFCVFWGYVSANGSVGTLANLKASSKKVTAVECNTYAGIYFELRRYSDSTNYRLCDYETVEIAKVQNGDSNLIVDLDNQADQFGTDSNDVVQGDAVRSTGVSLYYGSDPQEFLASGGLTAQLYYASDNDELHPITNGNIATVDVSYSGDTGTVTVTVKDGATIADSGLFAKIVAKCAKDTTGKVAYFNLGKVKSGEPGKAPDICNLRPTSKSISFNKSELAGSTPKKLGCGYTLIKDSVTTNEETAESVVVNGVTYYIYWRYVGGTYARFTTSSAIWATGILPATSEKGVEFCLSSADTASDINTQNTLDTENVPIVKDGINGSATFHEIQSSQASVIVGAESTQAVINANFIFRLNTSGVYSAYSCYYAVYRRKGGAYTWVKSSSAKATTGSYSETENDYTKVDAFVVVMSDTVIGTANALPSSFLSKLEIPVEKQGGRGPQGEAAWAFSANPANVIITQSLDNNLTSFSSATVSFAAKKGRESATITSIAIPTGQQALSNEFNATIGTGDDSKKVIVSSPKTHGTPAEYYTEGSFKVVVNAQAPDGSTSSQEVTVLCYANLLGTWKRKVVGDAEAVAAAKVAYIYDPNNPNQVVKMETFGDYVRSSTENSAKLERDTTEVIENIANTAFEDIEGTQVALSAGEYIVQLKVDTEDLPTGNYVFDFAGFHYEGGEQFIEQRINVSAGTYTITLHDDIQSGTGVATMLYISRVFNVSSEIKQTADNIQHFVKDGLDKTGIDITNGNIDIVAGKVTFSYYDNGTKKSDKISINADTGTLKAVDVDLTGKITATSGSIGGFDITGSQISSSNNNIILSSDGSAKLGGFNVANNGTASLKSTMTVGNANSQRIEIIPFDKNKQGSGTINFINANSDKILKIGFYNDYYGSIDLYSPATNQNPEECAVSVRSNYLQISSENTNNAKESYITMLTSTNNAYSQYTFDDKVNKMFLTSGVEGGTLMLRAHKQDGSSAWPRCLLDPDGANWMDKGHVHVMTMGELKVLLNNPYSIYSSHLANYAVMLTRIDGN